jgi:hypothetical protein
MKKIIFVVAVIFVLTGLFFSYAYCGGDIKVEVKDLKNNGNGQIVIHYTLTNTYGFEYPNTTLGFKVSQDKKPIGCQRIQEPIPENADGTEIIELVIDADTGGKPIQFEYVLFTGGVDFNKVEEWFAGCN